MWHVNAIDVQSYSSYGNVPIHWTTQVFNEGICPKMRELSQKIPPEILTQIFERIYLIAVNIPQRRLAEGKDVRQLCWPVSQVCQYWREVALAAPFLWAYLPTINLDDTKSPSASQQLECLKTLLPRTRNHTMHISAVGSIDMDFGHHLEVVNYITGYCERWETLSVNATSDYLDEFFGEIHGCLPQLEMLKLDLLEGDGAALSLFKDCPKLNCVYITGTPSGWLNLDTRALLHLYDDTTIIMHNLQATHGFPHLTTLEIRDTGHSFDDSHKAQGTDERVFLFPILKLLDYSCDDEFPADRGFLKFIKTPALEDLSVTAGLGDVIGCLMELHSRCKPLSQASSSPRRNR